MWARSLKDSLACREDLLRENLAWEAQATLFLQIDNECHLTKLNDRKGRCISWHQICIGLNYQHCREPMHCIIFQNVKSQRGITNFNHSCTIYAELSQSLNALMNSQQGLFCQLQRACGFVLVDAQTGEPEVNMIVTHFFDISRPKILNQNHFEMYYTQDLSMQTCA